MQIVMWLARVNSRMCRPKNRVHLAFSLKDIDNDMVIET
jgi:hypothetical protein